MEEQDETRRKNLSFSKSIAETLRLSNFSELVINNLQMTLKCTLLAELLAAVLGSICCVKLRRTSLFGDVLKERGRVMFLQATH